MIRATLAYVDLDKSHWPSSGPAGRRVCTLIASRSVVLHPYNQSLRPEVGSCFS
jgi:hypothetical protein